MKNFNHSAETFEDSIGIDYKEFFSAMRKVFGMGRSFTTISELTEHIIKNIDNDEVGLRIVCFFSAKYFYDTYLEYLNSGIENLKEILN